jgi:CRISPR-associated protein Cas1
MIKDFYIFNSGRLKRKDSTILFLDQEDQKRTLPIEQIETLHIFGEVDFNSSFFNLLNSHGIFVHMYNYYGFYAGGFVPRKKQVSGYVDLQQAQYCWDLDKRLYIAKMFLEGAVHHMVRNLRRKQADMEVIISQMEEEKPKLFLAKKIDELMGIEGRIRQIYYSAIPQLIAKSPFTYEKREKRPSKDPINALISFGNTQMYTTVLGEIYKTSLNPTISFLHQPTSRRFSLCLDLAEIFKPLIVDSLIFHLINNRMLLLKHFEWIDKKCFLNEEGKKLFLSEYKKKLETTVKHRKLNRKVSYRTFIRLECYKLIKHLLGDELYKPLKAWW